MSKPWSFRGDLQTFQTISGLITVPHQLGEIASEAFIVGRQYGAARIYRDPTTPWDKSNIYLRASSVGSRLTLFILPGARSLIPFQPSIVVEDFVLIGAQTLLVDTTTITLSSIPGTYTNLMLTFMGRNDFAGTADNAILQFNGDTGANYHWQRFYTTAATITEDEGVNATYINIGAISGNTATASYASGLTVMIYSYAGTTFFKPITSINAHTRTAVSGNLFLVGVGGHWRNTSAISSLTISQQTGGTKFKAGSTATLYGLP